MKNRLLQLCSDIILFNYLLVLVWLFPVVMCDVVDVVDVVMAGFYITTEHCKLQGSVRHLAHLRGRASS